MERPVFHARYRTWTALERDCRQQLRLRGLLLRTEVSGLEQFARVAVLLTIPDGEELELLAEVVQILPGQGVAVQFEERATVVIDGLIEKCAKHLPAPTPGREETQEDPQFHPPGDEPPRSDPASVAEPENLQRQIEQMTVNQKRQAALHGRKNMRMLLIRDRNKTIHPFVIQNPAITLDEVEQLAKMPSLNPDVLRTIARNKEWIRSAAVCRNLVRNPMTPMKEALLLLDKLPPADVRALAKSGNVRTAIQQAARKKVAG